VSRAVSVTRFERKLRAILGAQGSSLLPGVEDFAGLITLEADRPEWALAGGERLCWGRQTQAAVAAVRSCVALINPLDSGVLVVVELVRRTGAVAVELRFFNPPVATLVALALDTVVGFHRDTRIGQDIPAARLQAYTNAGGGGGTFVEDYTTSESIIGGLTSRSQPIVVGPDTALIINTVADLTAIAASFRWRELALEGSRLG